MCGCERRIEWVGRFRESVLAGRLLLRKKMILFFILWTIVGDEMSVKRIYICGVIVVVCAKITRDETMIFFFYFLFLF